MSHISYGFAFFLGTFLECIMYGIFVCLFVAACYVQWDKFTKNEGPNRVMVFATVFFGFTITANCALTLVRAIRAVFYTPEGMTVYQALDPPYRTEEIVRWGVFETQIVVADIIMVYRMYHIYGRNLYVCAIPSITITALFAVGCGLTNQFRNLTTPSDQKALANWSSACFCLTIFNSCFLTVMISFKLWGVYRESANASVRVGESIILRAMKVLIESAALWTAFVAMNFFAFLAGNNLMHAFVLMTSPAVGISFCLIIVRFGNVFPQARDEAWHISIRTPALRTLGSDPVSVPLSQVKVQQDSCTGESNPFPIGVFESRKRGYITSGGLPKIDQSSFSLSTPT